VSTLTSAQRAELFTMVPWGVAMQRIPQAIYAIASYARPGTSELPMWIVRIMELTRRQQSEPITITMATQLVSWCERDFPDRVYAVFTAAEMGCNPMELTKES
jgi:hypothetical protein